MNIKEMNKPKILSSEERKPYLTIERVEMVDSFGGSYDADLDVWDIDKLLQAQLDDTWQKAKEYYEGEK